MVVSCRTAAGLLALAAAGGCLAPDDPSPAGAIQPDAPRMANRAGYLVAVDTRRRAVSVARPGGGDASSALGPSFSILEGNTIGLEVGNYSVSAVGATRPGKIRVQFDVAVTNRLPGVALVAPALGGATPAAGSLMLFPMLQDAALTTGEATSSDDGSVLVTRTARTVVEPSVDWNGDGTLPEDRGFDFSGDSVCRTPAPGCTRWEAVPPLASGSASPVRTVGFDLDPAVSDFRAWLLLVADLENESGGPVSPPPPPGQGVPFGPTGLLGLPDDDEPGPTSTEPFTLAKDSYTPANLIYRIIAARASGMKLILTLTGGDHELYMTGGVFDRAKWDARLALFDSDPIRQAIADGVADGTIIGASVMDEPHVSGLGDGNTWGPPGTMTKARVDSLCADTKARFPTLPVGVAHPYSAFEPDVSYRVCDFIISQYSDRLGDVAAYRDGALALGRRDGHDVLFAINILNGGPQAERDGQWTCPSTSGGRGQYEPNCRMSPQQIVDWSVILGPAGCGGLLMWRYDADFMAQPANQQAFAEAARRLATLPSRPCVRR